MHVEVGIDPSFWVSLLGPRPASPSETLRCPLHRRDTQPDPPYRGTSPSTGRFPLEEPRDSSRRRAPRRSEKSLARSACAGSSEKPCTLLRRPHLVTELVPLPLRGRA